MTETCPNCHGEGELDDQTCTYCEGDGVIVSESEARPLAAEEYANWRKNIHTFAEMEAGSWNKREGDGFVSVKSEPTGEFITTIEMQLRLAATIDAKDASIRELTRALPLIVFAVQFELGEKGVTWERCCRVWEGYMLPSLTKEHDGDCVKQPQACARCQTEECIRIADLLKDALASHGQGDDRLRTALED